MQGSESVAKNLFLLGRARCENDGKALHPKAKKCLGCSLCLGERCYLGERRLLESALPSMLIYTEDGKPDALI